MKVHIVRSLPKDGYDVYFYYESSGMRIAVTLEDGRFVMSDTKYGFGQELPVTLFFDSIAYEALRRAMIGEAIDRDDTLQDTRRVRDRLLTMVETEWQSRQ